MCGFVSFDIELEIRILNVGVDFHCVTDDNYLFVWLRPPFYSLVEHIPILIYLKRSQIDMIQTDNERTANQKFMDIFLLEWSGFRATSKLFKYLVFFLRLFHNKKVVHIYFM